MNCPRLLAISSKALPSSYGHADWHWRVQRPWTRLAERGIDVATCWLGSDDRPTISPAGRLVILQRVVKAGSEAEVASWVQSLRDAGAIGVVFEIDDDEISPAVLEWMESAGGLERIVRARLERERLGLLWTMQASDAVTVSTEPLSEVVRQYTDAPVLVVPNAIDVEWFTARLAPRPEWADVLTIGWAGGRRPEADLEPMAQAWARIATRYPHVRFIVAGWQSDVIYRELDAVDAIDRIIRVPWLDLDRYPEAYQTDIGCCPLADTPFNRAKSPIKSWEFALAGAAVVASPTVYHDCVYGGPDSGPRTDGDWEAVLELLVSDPYFRRGDGLREHVERQHSLTASLGAWVRAYSEIAASVGGMA